MTIGIYRLVFEGTSSCYIGQSINIEQRFSKHLHSFYNHTANIKMLKAYEKYGLPSLDILCECSVVELDHYENEAIEIFDAVNSGFNILKIASDIPNVVGDKNGNSKYSNAQILEVANLLTDISNSGKYISEVTGVSLATIQGISSLNSHNWLASADPNLYLKLEQLTEIRKCLRTASARKIQYPPVISPQGVIYKNIDNLREFCRYHKLHQPNFCQMLHGKRQSCSGWLVYKNG